MLGSGGYPIRLLLLILLGGGVAAFLFFGKPAPKQEPLATAPVPLVEFITARESEYPISIQSQGVLDASKRIEVVAEVSGRIESINDSFAAGGGFSADEVLLSIDDTEYQTALSRAEADVAEAERLLATERGAARQAEREWRDLKSSEANDLFLRKPQIKSAEAALAAAKSQREKARQDLKKTRLSLPFTGRVISKEVDYGEFITSGRTIAEVFALDSAELRLPLSTEQLYQLGDAVGSEVVISSGVEGVNYQWVGVIARVESAVDSVSRLHYVVARIENPFEISIDENNQVRPALALGQYVQAAIKTARKDQLLAIPRNALRQPQNIWLLDAENKLIVAAIELLERNADYALIRIPESVKATLANVQGLSSGAFKVVTSDLSQVVSGMQTAVESADGLSFGLDKKS